MADAKQGNPPIEDFYNGSTSQSRVVLAKPRLGGFGASSFASGSSKSCNPFSSVLRPSTLKAGSNPFLKVTEKEDEVKDDKDKKEDDSEDRLKEKESKEEPEAPKFVPLGSANVTPRTTNPVPAPAQPAASSSSGFVFGQNLSERVVIENMNNGEVGSVDHSSANGTTDLLFTSAAASVKENQEEARSSASSPLPASDGAGLAGAGLAGTGLAGVGLAGAGLAGAGLAGAGLAGTGLAAAAAEYERSHARPPPPAAQYSLTGEEGEVNVLQISCRLFAWEGGSWRERGRGVLRLNEAEPAGEPPRSHSARLVCRVAGSLRVVLNTKLWPDMVVERAGTKSLRITAATEEQQIKLYLIMGAPADIAQLYRALSSRVATIKRTAPVSTANICNNTSQQAAERLEAQHDADYHENPADTPADDNPGDNTKNPDDSTNNPDDNTNNPDDNTNNPDDNPNEETEKPLKRKEPVEDEVTPKRQCPDAE